MRVFVAAVLITICLLGCGRQKEYQIMSTDQDVRLSVYLDQARSVRYQLAYRGKSVLSESVLGVALKDADFTNQQYVASCTVESINIGRF